jgi:hypothetical protein
MSHELKKPVLPDSIAVDEVLIRDRRPLDEESLPGLTDSMSRIGLRHPITLRLIPAGSLLVAGYHRLEAAKVLGWEMIPCNYMEGDELDARLWEIAENLHRAELTALQRDEQIAEWVRIWEQKQAAAPGQFVQEPQGGRPEGGVAQAARELSVPGKTADARRKTIERAIEVAGLTDEAKAAAKDVGLDDNQSALRKIAKESTRGAQVKKVKEIAKQNGAKQRGKRVASRSPISWSTARLQTARSRSCSVSWPTRPRSFGSPRKSSRRCGPLRRLGRLPMRMSFPSCRPISTDGGRMNTNKRLPS